MTTGCLFKNLYSQDHNTLKIRLMCDSLIKATSDETDFSISLANLRELFNQENIHSTTQRLRMIYQLPLIFSEISTGHCNSLDIILSKLFR